MNKLQRLPAETGEQAGLGVNLLVSSFWVVQPQFGKPR